MKRARWVAEGDACTVERALDGMPPALARRALEEGRVFVDGARVADGALALAPGAVVEVFEPRNLGEGVVVLAERAGVVIAAKPAWMPSEPDRAGTASVVESVAAELCISPAEVHAVGRLDVGVSGVMVLSTSEKSREVLARATLSRRYLAISTHGPEADEGEWSADVGGRAACTRFTILARVERALLIEARPKTGRKHQIRVHAAGAGVALYGDRKYGGPARVADADGAVHEIERIALHAESVTLQAPGARVWTVRERVPPPLRALWARLEGDDLVWDAR